MPPLTDKAIAQAKPKEKSYRMYDSGGLYLEISPSGGKLWRLKYRFDRKEKRLSLGTYPLVSLKTAREKAFEAKVILGQGVDPSQKKKEESCVKENLFKDICRKWWETSMTKNKGSYPEEAWRRIERDVLPFIGSAPIETITTSEITPILRKIVDRGAFTTAHRVKSYISQTMRYAIACGLIYNDPVRDLTRILPPERNKPMAAIIDPKRVGALMRSIYGYSGSETVRCALKMSALTFLRPGELRQGEWKEIDFNVAEWRLPAEKMKGKRPHLVPLSRQALDVLRTMYALTGHERFIFPSERSPSRPMSDMTVNAALRAMGYSAEEMTAHGFRAMANSLLAEQNWSIDAIERQLAHAERNKVRAAYHRADHLAERKKMMQSWADYLDMLRESV